MYRLVLHEFVGPVPYYLYEWFGDSPAFLNVDNAFWTLAVVETLQWTPFAFLLFYMAYQAVPTEVRQAASIVIAFFVRFIDGFRVFDNVYTLTGSGAGGSTTSLSIYIYQAFFKQGAIGKAVAASVILFIASFAVLFCLNWLASRRKG